MNTAVPILFTIPNFITAGSGRVMLNIVERLDQKKFAPAICVMKKGGSLDKEVEKLGIPFLEAPFAVAARPYGSLYFRAKKAAAVFRPYRFALWHSFHFLDDYTEPMIARLAGTGSWIYTKKAMGWGSRAWLLRSYLSTRIVADNSEMPMLMFNRIGLRHKVQIIHHGIPTDQFKPGTSSQELRKEKNLPMDAVLIGCVAHLLPVKGHPTLLEAVSNLPGAHLVFAGKPLNSEYVISLERMIQELRIQDRVHFLGNVSNVPSLLAELDIFVLPTWAKWRMEGCPVALLEAMACGKACIATDIPGSRDLIEHGKSGWIVPPENVGAMTEALKHLASSECKRRMLGQAARERIETRFTIEREVADHEALYDEILLSGNSGKVRS